MREKKTKENKRQLWKRMCSLLVACALIVMSGPQQAAAAPTAGDTGAQPGASVIRSDELRGVWVSYLDWEQLPAERGAYQLAVDKILDRCTELKMNAVFVHVRPDADAMYPSQYFPWSRFVTGTQGPGSGL